MITLCTSYIALIRHLDITFDRGPRSHSQAPLDIKSLRSFLLLAIFYTWLTMHRRMNVWVKNWS